MVPGSWMAFHGRPGRRTSHEDSAALTDSSSTNESRTASGVVD